ITTAAQPYYCTVLPVTPCLLLLSSAPPPPSPTLFPYTTLFRSRTGAADDRAARDAGAEIDVSWRGASGNVADRGEGNQRRRFAVRTLRQGDGPAAFGESGSQTACYASVSAGGSARSDSVCPEPW